MFKALPAHEHIHPFGQFVCTSEAFSNLFTYIEDDALEALFADEKYNPIRIQALNGSTREFLNNPTFFSSTSNINEEAMIYEDSFQSPNGEFTQAYGLIPVYWLSQDDYSQTKAKESYHGDYPKFVFDKEFNRTANCVPTVSKLTDINIYQRLELGTGNPTLLGPVLAETSVVPAIIKLTSGDILVCLANCYHDK